MGNTFFDASASAFVIHDLQHSHHMDQQHHQEGPTSLPPPPSQQVVNSLKQSCVRGQGEGIDDETALLMGEASADSRRDPRGGALGPEWVSKTGFVDQMLPAEITSRKGSLQVMQRKCDCDRQKSYSVCLLDV